MPNTHINHFEKMKVRWRLMYSNKFILFYTLLEDVGFGVVWEQWVTQNVRQAFTPDVRKKLALVV